MKPLIAKSAVAAAALLVVPALNILSVFPATAYPGEHRVLSSQALEKYEAGEYLEAEELYRRAAETAGEKATMPRFNMGAAAYKAGKVDEAEKVFRSVYDQDNKLLNASAGYNLGVIEHSRAKPALEKAQSAPSLQEIPPDQLETLKKEIEDGIKQLEKAQYNYRDAILRTPADKDIKVNYEVASRDLEFLRKKLEQLQPPPQEQQQQSDQQEQSQDQKDQNQQGQDQKQEPQDNQQQQQDQQQGDQKQNQDQKDQQESEQKNKDQQKDKQQDKQNQGQDKPDDQGQPKDQDGEPEEGESDQDDKPSEKPPEDSKGKPDPNQKGQGTSGGEQKDAEPVAGEMSERDVERLLNALPADNTDALQRMLNVRNTRETDMEKDW